MGFFLLIATKIRCLKYVSIALYVRISRSDTEYVYNDCRDQMALWKLNGITHGNIRSLLVLRTVYVYFNLPEVD